MSSPVTKEIPVSEASVSEVSVSIVICTRNRADHLRHTLEAISRLEVPAGYRCDLTVVDNASTDGTAALAQSFPLGNMPLHHVLESQPGLAHAYNAGTASTHGNILLYTDDDVRPLAGWLEGMCAPIASGSADAVAGGIKTAPHLLKPWIKKEHVSWLASTEFLSGNARTPLIGASMAFSRQVLERVPLFDTEVRQGMDSLFSYQLETAGYRVVMALDAVAEHHFQPERLTRESFLTMARRRGEQNAYFARHWFHSEPRRPYLTLLRAWAALWARRLLFFREWATSLTVPAWELRLLETLHTARCHLAERRVPRKYAQFGLVKRKPAETASEQSAVEPPQT